MKKHFLILLMLGAAVGCWAQGPNDSGEYYKAADGKKGAALKTALCGIIYNRDEEGAFSKTHEITKMVETDRYITYFYSTHVYSGGAHGFTTEVGFTFRKSDGKQIPLLTNTDSPKLSALIKEGVRRHFSDDAEHPLSDEELLEYLFAEEVGSLNHIPLPGNPPYLSETGVVFNYTQYEIGPYSSGIIIFEIPFQDIRPFLTPEALELIRK